MLWSVIAGLAPTVKTGQVRLCVIDPKGGMELGAGEALFSAFSHDATDTTPDATVQPQLGNWRTIDPKVLKSPPAMK